MPVITSEDSAAITALLLEEQALHVLGWKHESACMLKMQMIDVAEQFNVPIEKTDTKQ